MHTHVHYLSSKVVDTELEARSIPIFRAVTEDNLTELNRLIEKGEDVNIQAPGGLKTALHLAVEFNRPAMVDVLIRASTNVNAKTRNGTTPLHVAAQNGRVALIEKLVGAGGTVDVFSEIGCTPLHEAAANGHKEATLKLLELKANPGIKDRRYHLTAANLAQLNGHNEIKTILGLPMFMTTDQLFIQNASIILFNIQERLSKTSAEYFFVHQLANSIKPIEDGDDVFRKCDTALKSKAYQAVKARLKGMETSLLTNMSEYTENKLDDIKIAEVRQRVLEGSNRPARKKKGKQKHVASAEIPEANSSVDINTQTTAIPILGNVPRVDAELEFTPRINAVLSAFGNCELTVFQFKQKIDQVARTAPGIFYKQYGPKGDTVLHRILRKKDGKLEKKPEAVEKLEVLFFSDKARLLLTNTQGDTVEKFLDQHPTIAVKIKGALK